MKFHLKMTPRSGVYVLGLLHSDPSADPLPIDTCLYYFKIYPHNSDPLSQSSHQPCHLLVVVVYRGLEQSPLQIPFIQAGYPPVVTGVPIIHVILARGYPRPCLT